MSLDPRAVPGESAGFLKGCLVEGDAEQRMRERRVRRRALVISVALQSVVLAALVLVPLLGKPERIAFASFVPMPPYHHPSGATQPNTSHDVPRHVNRSGFCFLCPSPRVPTATASVISDLWPDPAGPDLPTGSSTDCSSGCIDIGRTADKQPAPSHSETPARKERLHVTHLDPAMLIHRIEPVYPTLPRQMGRSGRVELRAIIATDGSIQSLQVVGGDPLFYQSAMEAVSQWRYSPTVLNGQPVEIDTYISVIYTMQR